MIDRMAGAVVPFETTVRVWNTCLCLHTQRAARVLARRFDEAMRPAGLTNRQFSLLMSLNRPEPAPMGKIAGLLGADRTTLTAALKPLTAEGLVVVSIDPDDSRVRRLALTNAGQARLAAAMPLWTAAHGALEAELTGVDADDLRRDLVAMSAAPEEDEDICA